MSTRTAMTRKRALSATSRPPAAANDRLFEEQSMHSFAMEDAAAGAVTVEQQATTPKPKRATRARRNSKPDEHDAMPMTSIVPPRIVRIDETANRINRDTPSPEQHVQQQQQQHQRPHSLPISTAAHSSDSEDSGTISFNNARYKGAQREFESRAPGQMSEEHTFVPPIAPSSKAMPKSALKSTSMPKTTAATTTPMTASTTPIIATTATTTSTKTKASIIAAQQTKRSSARSALDSLRRGVIPGYDDVEPDAIDDENRSVVIDRDAFASLVNDSGEEYQDANKPPWAASLPPDVVAKIKDWIVLDTLSELKLRATSWYSFATLVAGAVRLPISALVIIGPQTASAQAVRPTNAALAGISFGDSMATGAGGISDALLKSSASMTPLRVDEQGRAFQPGQARAAAGFGLAAAAGAEPSAPPPIDDALENFRASGIYNQYGSLFADIDIPVPGVESRTTIATTARFRDLRKHNASITPAPWYATTNTPNALRTSQVAREAGARGLPWINRSIATVVYYFNPFFVSAREFAYSKMTIRAGQLRHVAPRFFMEDRPNDSDQMRIRSMFAAVVAAEFNMLKHQSNNSSKLAADAANIAGASENAMQFFENLVSFNSSTGRFSILYVQNGINRQPIWLQQQARTSLNDPAYHMPQQRVVRAPTRGDKYRRFDVETDPLRDDYSFGSLIRTPGTMYTRMND